jgi:hypothetical protein
MKPQRYIVTHGRTVGGQNLFSVSPNRRSSRFAADVMRRDGHTVVSQTARFDFTLAAWGLSLDAVMVSNHSAAMALANVNTTPKAPRAARQGRGRRGGPAFSTPKPTVAAAKLTVLASLEDLFALVLRDSGITPEARKEYERYSKLKALALGPASTTEAQTEANSALRASTIALIKLTY